MFAIPTETEFTQALEGVNTEVEIVASALQSAHEVMKGRYSDPMEDIGRIYLVYITILHTRNGTIK